MGNQFLILDKQIAFDLICVEPLATPPLMMTVDLTAPPFNFRFDGNFPHALELDDAASWDVKDDTDTSIKGIVSQIALTGDHEFILGFSEAPATPIVHVTLRILYNGIGGL